MRLTISNPAKRNALDHPILDAITATLGELARARLGARCVIVTGAHGMFSAGYDIGEIPDEEFEERAERARRAPVHRGDRRARGLPLPDARGAARPHDRRRPRAGALLRPAHRRRTGSSSACRRRSSASSTRTPGLRRFIDAIGAARTRELFLLGRYIDADTALAWGLVNRVAPGRELEAPALELAAELAGNAPLSQTGNKRVIAALLRAEGELAAGRRGGADRAAPRVLRLARTCARGCARSPRDAEPRRAGSRPLSSP